MFIVERTRFVTICGHFFVIQITSCITTTVVNKFFFRSKSNYRITGILSFSFSIFESIKIMTTMRTVDIKTYYRRNALAI